jgi:hypothetical protein
MVEHDVPRAQEPETCSHFAALNGNMSLSSHTHLRDADPRQIASVRVEQNDVFATHEAGHVRQIVHLVASVKVWGQGMTGIQIQ